MTGLRAWLLRRWFLLLLAAGLGVALWRPDWLLPLAAILPLRGIVALSLLLMAWSLEGQRLTAALRRPGGIGLALLVSFGLLPLLALLLAPLLPRADLRPGLLLIACVPCTLSSAVLWTRQAGGNEALALLVVVATNALGWLVTPLWLGAAGPATVALDTAALMRSLLLVLVVPVVLGQALRGLPGVAAAVARHHRLNNLVARLLVAVVLISAAAEAAGQLDRLLPWQVLTTAAACLAVHLGGLLLALAAGRLAGLPRDDRIAVAIAGSQKTLPVALVVFTAHYRADYPLAVLPLLLYHAGQLLADTLVADRLAGQTAPLSARTRPVAPRPADSPPERPPG